MLLDFNSKWFRSYSRAVMESEPDIARIYIRDALIEINNRLRKPHISDSEREAMALASHYLDLIQRVELAKTA